MFRSTVWLVLLAGLVILGGCAGAGAGGGDSAGGDTEIVPDGISVSIDTEVTSTSSLSTAAASGVPVSRVFFRSSSIDFYAVDTDLLVTTAEGNAQDIADQMVASRVSMPLDDVIDTISFNRYGASELPIDQVGNFKDKKYNLININIGGGRFRYETTDSDHYYEVPAPEGSSQTTIKYLATDRVHVSNILLVDATLWETLTGSTSIAVWTNDDSGYLHNADTSTDPQDYVVSGSGTYDLVEFTDNRLINVLKDYAFTADHNFDVDGCIVYPMSGPIDLSSFAALENGYHNIDQSEVALDISIGMSWDMPQSTDYLFLSQDTGLNDTTFMDVYALATHGKLYDACTQVEKDELDEFYGNIIDRFTNRTVSPQNVYDFDVSVNVRTN